MTISEADFRAEAAAFLEANAERRVEEKFEWGKGSDRVSMLEEKSPEQEAAELTAGEGVEGDGVRRRLRVDHRARGVRRAGAPRRLRPRVPRRRRRVTRSPTSAPFGIGLGMVAPTILAHAIPEVKERYLRPLYRGELVGCQLFSEPVAGSDLAGIQTRAVRDGDEWVISGQKVWTSGAQYSDIGEIITRTDPDKPKHKGLTMFLVDMKATGVEVRPLRQMTGGASFNEVFFDDVRVPDTHRLGDVDEGWTVALTTLMNERAAIGGGGSRRRRGELLPVHRDGAAPRRSTTIRSCASASPTSSSGPTCRATRTCARWRRSGRARSRARRCRSRSSRSRRTGSASPSALAQILGPRLIADTGEWGTYAWAEFVLGIPGMRVAGGTDEIMRNIVGERVLGLPKEPPAAK